MQLVGAEGNHKLLLCAAVEGFVLIWSAKAGNLHLDHYLTVTAVVILGTVLFCSIHKSRYIPFMLI